MGTSPDRQLQGGDALDAFNAWFVRETGREWPAPEDEIGLRTLLAEAGFTPTEVRLLRSDEEVARYYGEPIGAFASEVAARLKAKRTSRLNHECGNETTAPREIVSTNRDSDAWMYAQKQAGKTHGEISAALRRDHAEWEYIESSQGIGAAIRRYAIRLNLPELRSKRGRPKSSKPTPRRKRPKK